MEWYSQGSFCKDLPTKPVPETGIILVTGASGYIGGRLVPELLERGYRVRVMVRKYSEEQTERWPEAEVVIADAMNPDQLRWVMKDVAVAYYLMHSILPGKKEFIRSDMEAAVNFRTIAGECGLKRIIYLAASGDPGKTLESGKQKDHYYVPDILREGKVPVTVLNAAIIIGSGSASFELMRSIVRNIPVIILPSWSKNKIQPVGIRDVIKYLVGVLETELTTGKTYDIGSDDVLTYRDMLKTMAKVLNKRRLFLPTPIRGIKLYSYLISLISPVPTRMIAGLIRSIRKGAVMSDHSIREVIPFPTVRFKVSLLRAISREEHDRIATRWSDSYPPAHELAIKLSELEEPPRYISSYSIISYQKAKQIFEQICGLGGKRGWFNMNFLWQVRGAIDRVFMGVGTARGRRSAHSLAINDVIDFWRVEDLVRNKKLLLRAEMKVPGKAWLEFVLDEVDNHNILIVTAYFQPKGYWGRIYWYLFLPFHYFIFKDILRHLSKGV